MNEKGFTLIEIMAVIVIMGVMSSIFIKRNMELHHVAEERAIYSAIATLNSVENATWAGLKIDRTYIDDMQVFTKIDYALGSEYTWLSLSQVVGTLRFKETSMIFTRDPSTPVSAPFWHQ